MNAGESVPNAFLMREKRIDENSAQGVLNTSLLKNSFLTPFLCHTHILAVITTRYAVYIIGCTCRLFHTSVDWPAEAGVVKEGVGAVGSADETRDSQQPELRLQTAYRGAQRVSHCQRATCCHPANRGMEKNSSFVCTHTYLYTLNQANNTLSHKYSEPNWENHELSPGLRHITANHFITLFTSGLKTALLLRATKNNINAQCSVTAHPIKINNIKKLH